MKKFTEREEQLLRLAEDGKTCAETISGHKGEIVDALNKAGTWRSRFPRLRVTIDELGMERAFLRRPVHGNKRIPRFNCFMKKGRKNKNPPWPVGWKINPFVCFVRHSNKPNCKIVEVDDGVWGVVALKSLPMSTEITVNFKEIPFEWSYSASEEDNNE